MKRVQRNVVLMDINRPHTLLRQQYPVRYRFGLESAARFRIILFAFVDCQGRVYKEEFQVRPENYCYVKLLRNLPLPEECAPNNNVPFSSSLGNLLDLLI